MSSLMRIDDIRPDKPAVIMAATGTVVTFGELTGRSRRIARFFRELGLERGDTIAIMLENRAEYYEIFWAATRSGLYYTPINWHLQHEEARYIVTDCGARVLFVSDAVAETTEALGALPGVTIVTVDKARAGWRAYADILSAFSDSPLDGETEGGAMYYSSGTTGRPKGIKRPLTGTPYGDPGIILAVVEGHDFSADMVYLNPAPLYHAAPLGWSNAAIRFGGTCVCMERFDPMACLKLIEHYRVTHAQFVPTMFVRMLKLPDAERLTPDVSSLKVAVHAAAPCPVEVKARMIDWWGPVLYEYYSASEGIGMTKITSSDWLGHKGSVGRAAVGLLHIVGEDGEELPPGEPGVVYFEGLGGFAYHNDDGKTAGAYNDKGWATVGDIGYVDEAGYLFLTDRLAHMIISGGVNIYPQEIESVLTLHPEVDDVAVIGVPHPEFGEEVKAVVVPANSAKAGPALEQALIDYCRARIAHFKCPRSVDFIDTLPRLASGKMLKRQLKQRYWPS